MMLLFYSRLLQPQPARKIVIFCPS